MLPLISPLLSSPPVQLAAATVESIPFWERFVTSAGAGGLAALTAAIIAAVIARAQLRNTKKQQQHDRWWDTLSWVYDRAIVDAGKKESLPHRVTFTMLTELEREARTPPVDRLQEGTIESVLSMFSSSTGTETPRSALEVSDPVAIDLMEQLRANVEQARQARGESPASPDSQYAGELRKTLERLAVPFEAVRHSSYPFHFIVERPGVRYVYVDAAFGDSGSDWLYVRLGRLRTFLNESPRTAMAVIVVNTDLTPALLRAFEKFDDERIRVAVWHDQRDDRTLSTALQF